MLLGGCPLSLCLSCSFGSGRGERRFVIVDDPPIVRRAPEQHGDQFRQARAVSHCP
jgi:hypothetical protein